MIVKKVITKDFYSTMVDWCKGNNFKNISPAVLPEYTFVIFKEDIPIYSTCFYNTDSNLAWIGWELKNPHTTKKQREGGLKVLINHIGIYAKSLGYQILFTTSNTKPVENTMLQLGFEVGDVNVKHYIKQL